MNSGSIGLISDSPGVETAVVFVHGFLGDPTATWLNFHGLVDDFPHEFPWWQNCDMLFFNYDSVANPIQISSDRLMRFLTAIYPEPTRSSEDVGYQQAGFADTLRRIRGDNFRYSRLVLVGHSEGAVVIRQMVLNIMRPFLAFCQRQIQVVGLASANPHLRRRVRQKFNPKAIAQTFAEITTKARQEFDRFAAASNPEGVRSVERSLARDLVDFMQNTRHAVPSEIQDLQPYWVLTADLCLFAPAHFGYSPSGLLGTITRLPLVSELLESIVSWSTAYNDLRTLSPVLRSLQQATEKFQSEFGHIPALRASVLWGEDDRLLSMGSYMLDAPEPSERAQNHTSICKPKVNYRRPMEFVRYGKLARIATA
ncbi:MAG TPA: hypothetical protein VG096_19695 [Bryobacteraceae bacterium]|nr:hypothetical protein [Bryobacteraceae bacterium]